MAGIFDEFRSLSKGVRAALPFLVSASETAETATEILEKARELGFAFRRQTGLDIIGMLRGKVDFARAARLLDPSRIVDPKLIPESVKNLLRNYSYSTIVRGVNPLTGEQVVRDVTISTNVALSENDIKNRAGQFALRGQSRSAITVDSIELSGAEKRSFIEE